MFEPLNPQGLSQTFSGSPVPHFHGPDIDEYCPLPAVELSIELTRALQPLGGFTLPDTFSYDNRILPNEPRALSEIRNLLSNDTQLASALGYINSTCGQVFGARSPGRAAALVYILGEMPLKDPEALVTGCLNLLHGTASPSTDLIQLCGDELLRTSRTALPGCASGEAKKLIVDEALAVFGRLTCFSLKHTRELESWITFLNREMNMQQSIELVDMLAGHLESGTVLSGYDHIVAVIKGGVHREAALQRSDFLSRATISRVSPDGSNQDGAPDALLHKEIPAWAVAAPIGVVTAIELGAAALTGTAQFAATSKTAAVLLGVAFALRGMYNHIILPQLIAASNNSRPITDQRIISWNVFYEKLRGDHIPSA